MTIASAMSPASRRSGATPVAGGPAARGPSPRRRRAGRADGGASRPPSSQARRRSRTRVVVVVGRSWAATCVGRPYPAPPRIGGPAGIERRVRPGRQPVGGVCRTPRCAGPDGLVLGRYRPLRPLGTRRLRLGLARPRRAAAGSTSRSRSSPREGKAAARAEREADAAARLRHPSAASAPTPSARDPRHVYIAYEYVPGRTLREAMRAGELDDRARSRRCAQISTGSRTPTRAGSSTATSSRRTSCSPTATASRCGCSTSGSRRWPRPRR